MLARRTMPDEYREWNRRWGAPFGNRVARIVLDRAPSLARHVPRLWGPFAFQSNNNTRVYEYPWAFFAVPVEPGTRVLEIGGGLSGFQFVLSKSGARVINVDPGEDAFSMVGWPASRASIAPSQPGVRNRRATREHHTLDARLPDESIDCVYSISTIEHIPTVDHLELTSEIRRILRPGGNVVLTIDLFLDLAPFTSRQENRFGSNIDVRAFVDQLGFEKIFGDERELNGYPDFAPAYVLSELSELRYGNYPACAQLLVLRKP